MLLDKRARFIFEEVHAGDLTTTAITGSTCGYAGDQSVDVRVVPDGQIIAIA